jgi:hypothetical protein
VVARKICIRTEGSACRGGISRGGIPQSIQM